MAPPVREIRVYVRRVEITHDDNGEIEEPIDESVFDGEPAKRMWDIATSVKVVELVSRKRGREQVRSE